MLKPYLRSSWRRFRRKVRLCKYHYRRPHTAHPLLSLSLSVVIATGVVAYQSVSQAEHVPPLQNFRVRALGETTLRAGESLRLAAEGYYGTSPVVVKAEWNLLGGESAGYLVDCTESQECTFVATGGGTAVVEAQANHQYAHVNVEVLGGQSAAQGVFRDELPSWAAEPILDLNRKNIIRGYEDGRFGSADTLTNAQLITLITRMLLHLELIATPDGCPQYYDDVPQGHFAYHAACVFAERGWSTGLRTLGANAPANRTLTAQYIHRIFGPALLEDWGTSLGDILDAGEIFPDVPEDHPIFFESAVLHRAGIMKGYPDGRFGPDRTLNRAEAAAVVHRALEKARNLPEIF